MVSCQELRNAGGFTISLSSPSIVFNNLFVKLYGYNVCRLQETKLSELFHHEKEKESVLQN
jgi:hypothetical protein